MATTAFQSTFPRGERPKVTEIKSGIDDFNPRSRVGNDAFLVSIIVQVIKFQSTFPRGERLAVIFICSVLFLFQSTFPRGERHQAAQAFGRAMQFQSTFPRGERQSIVACAMAFMPYFNPRSRVGNDRKKFQRKCKIRISIHVPAWGTTLRQTQ